MTKSEWGDPEDTNPLRREQRKIRGFRVPDPLEALSDVRREHIEAANKLRRAWEVADGAKVGSARMVRVGDGFESGDGPTYIQVRAIQEVERMRNALGPRNWLAIWLVVLRGFDATALGERMRMSRHRAAGYLVAALDRLAELYAPRSKARHTIREDA